MVPVDVFRTDPTAATHLAALLESVDEAVLALDGEWTVLHLNSHAERLFDASRDDLLGRCLWDAWPGAKRTALYDHCQRAAADGERVAFEHRFDHLGRWFAVRIEPGRGGVALFARDVTDARQELRKLRDVEERFALAAAAVNDGIWDIDPRTGDHWCSPRCYELLGYAPGEVDADAAFVRETVHPDDLPRMWAAIEEHAGGRTPFYEVEFRMRHRDGGYRWFHSRGLAVRDEAGRVARVVGSQSDVTRRKEAEAATAAGESRLRLALAAAKMVAWESDLASGETVMSEGGESLWGARRLSSEEFNRRIHADDLPRVAAEWRRVIDCPEEQFHCEFRVVRADGVRWYASRGRAARGDDGLARRLFGVMTDVTERREAADALHRAKEAAEGANRAKDQFLAVLSHELRTPLTPVLLAAAALEDEPGLPAGAREDLAMIRRNVELETRLIDDLLDLSRIISGKMTLRPEYVPLHGVMRHVESMLEIEARAKGLTVAWEHSATADQVRADPARLNQVLWNLVNNAVKFTPKGGSVTVRSSNPAPGRVRVEVTDTGIGIEPGMLPRIFDAFDQGESGLTRSFGGLGLGLAISRAIAEMHGGTLTARSAGRGCGATFTLELATAGAPELLGTNQDLPPGAAASRATRILLVEDHVDTRNTLRRLLEMSGCAVVAVGRVGDAIVAAAGEKFDILVSDIDLPDGTGLDLVRTLRERCDGLPAVAVSGFGTDQDVRRSIDAGFLRHLTKPVNIKGLQEAIAEALAARANGSLQ